ncbi:MAG: hypothetical protein FJY97_03930 [candidate division Zixibacteria bacterium]|nr:hypothetical protein [candidate division Zixibacteria bacterium]
MGSPDPVIPVRLQIVYEDVDPSFGHNPRENKILIHDGTMYAFGTIPRRFPHVDEKEAYDKAIHTFPTGLFAFRCNDQGGWDKISETPTPWCSAALVGPDGTFWMEGTRNWDKFDLYRMRTPRWIFLLSNGYTRARDHVMGASA